MSEDRAELLGALSRAVTAAANSVEGEWDGFTVVAEITALGVRVTGFRYADGGPGQAMLMDADVIDTIARLRTASPGPGGELFDVYIARYDRGRDAIVDQAFSAADGAIYRVTAANVGRIGDLVRPSSVSLPSTPNEPPAAEPPAAEPPAAEPAPDAGAADDTAAPFTSDHPSAELPAVAELTAEPDPGPAFAPADPAPAPPAARFPPPPPPGFAPPPAPTDVTESQPPPPPTGAVSPPTQPPAAPPAAGPLTSPELTAAIVGSPELADSDWTAFGAAVAYRELGPSALGFRYADTGAKPALLGGDFLSVLARLRTENPAPNGEPPGAALVRLAARGATAQIRFIYGPAAQQITWTAADDTLAARLRPDGVDAPAGLAPRPLPDLLDVSTLLDRIRDDVRADLRSRSGWRSFAFATDVARDRSVAYLYSEDGRPERFELPLSPLADLLELRDQTARPDGAKWAGVVVHAWRTGGSRVDLTFHAAEGIDALLGEGPDAAGMKLRPNADPPANAPGPPWPAEGGHLDPTQLLDAVSAAWRASPDLAGGDWKQVAGLIVFRDTTPTWSALRYDEHGAATLTEIPDPGPIGKLRRSNPNDLGWQWDACVLRGHRSSDGLAAEYRFGSDADEYRLEPDRIGELTDRIRPV